jgi:hypothetical protein
MDHNKCVINGVIGKTLADKDGLDLCEAIVLHTSIRPGATFFCGAKPINKLWISSDLNISNACVMLFGYGVDNHCTFILNIPKLLVGIDPVKIAQPAGLQLNSCLPGCSKSYIYSFKANIVKHCLLKRLYNMHTGVYLKAENARKVIIIDE